MKRIYDNEMLFKFIRKYKIQDIFDNKIANYAQLHFYEKGEFMLKSETPLDYYFLLVDGKVQIYYLFENGKSMILKIYESLNSIGDIELLKDIPVRCNVEVLKDSYAIALPASIIRDRYMDNPKFLRHMISCLSEKLETTITNISYNYTYPLINRLSSYLIEYASDDDTVFITTSFKEIASFLGTTYRHLSRTFKELESRKIISCDGKIITILDSTTLSDLAKNEYKNNF